MAQPPPYVPSHAFVADSATLANFPGQQLDVEFNAIDAVIGDIESNIALIQRDDGALQNAVVTYDSLSPSLQSAGLAPMSGWLTGTSYLFSQIVSTSTGIYKCLISHTAAVFATDLAAGDWVLIATLPVGPQGVVGPTGPANTLAIGTVTAGAAAATITGAAPNQTLNLTLQTGSTGPTGPAGATGISGTPTINQFATFTNSTTIQGVSVTGLVKGNGASAPTAAVAGTDYPGLATSNAFTKQQTATPQTLTDATSIAWDVSLGQKAKVVLGGNRTMAAVTNAVEGTSYFLWAIQDGTGSRTLAYTTTGAGSFDFGASGLPVLTTTLSLGDLLQFEAVAIGGTLKLRFMGIRKGFA